jgi:hypothetical protein
MSFYEFGFENPYRVVFDFQMQEGLSLMWVDGEVSVDSGL